MDGAALALLVCGVGVSFGWQPMPDGAPRYEYIVQVEPGLAATLAEGQAIPIVSDIPEEVQPIARIRVVVGSGSLPRQRLVTRLKPAADEAVATGGGNVAQAAYDTPAGDRYGAAQGASGQPLPGQSRWNDGQTPPPTLAAEGATSGGAPTAPERTADSRNAWNNGSALPAAAAAASDVLTRVGDELRQTAEPLRSELDRVDDRVRGAVDRLGDRTRTLVDELGRPTGTQGPAAPDYRSGAPVADAASGAATWNATDRAPSAEGSSRTMPPAAESNPWNQPQQDAAAARQPAGAGPPSRTAADRTATAGSEADNYTWNNGAAPSTATAGPETASPPPAGNDPWAAASDPRPRAAAGAVQTAPQPQPTELANRPAPPFGGAGSTWPAPSNQFPVLTDPAAAPPSSAGQVAGQSASASSAQPPTARIGRGMLNEPATRPLDGEGAETAGAAANGPSDRGPLLSQSGPLGSTNPLLASSGAKETLNGRGNSALDDLASPARRDNAALVLAAWVLLSGSVAGNLYLFWSYLDVRQKYRALVRKTARPWQSVLSGING
jgi:hypothetical protein